MKVKCQLCGAVNTIKIDNRRIFGSKSNDEVPARCTECGEIIGIVISIS